MSHSSSLPTVQVSKWPFYLADLLIVINGVHTFSILPSTAHASKVWVLLISLACGIVVSLLPYAYEAGWMRSRKTSDETQVGEDGLATTTPGDPQFLAELAVLSWRIRKRAAQEPELNRMIIRNASKLLENLERCGVQCVSYLGRTIDVGSNVQILDTVGGANNLVIDESDPQVQVHGRMVRQALVIVGRGETPEKNSPPSHEGRIDL